MYFYVIEVADSESDVGLCNRGLVLMMFAFYHFSGFLHFVDQDVVIIYTLYLITPALILLISNSAMLMVQVMDVFKVFVRVLKHEKYK